MKMEQKTKLLEAAKDKLGAPTVEYITSLSAQIESALLTLAIDQSNKGVDIDSVTDTIRNFSNGLYGRVSSENLNPDKALTILNEAAEKLV